MNAPDAFRTALQFVLRHEGGYVNDPRDPGGETKYGISRRAYPELDISSLTLEDAGRIYKRDYWDRLSLDSLAPLLAVAVMDAAVNMGRGRAVKLLQTGLNAACGSGLAVDGIFGPATSVAARDLDDTSLRLATKESILARQAFYARLAEDASMRAFLRGWILRASALSEYLNETFSLSPEHEKTRPAAQTGP